MPPSAAQPLLSVARARASRVELYKLLAEVGRVQVLALCAEEALTVGELAELLGESQPQQSRRVASLREAGLLEARREGTRAFLRTATAALQGDAVVRDAVEEGRRLCLDDGSLARIPQVVAAREEAGRTHFESPPPAAVTSAPEHLAHLAALSPLLPGKHLAVDVGTGEGLVLDVLAPLYHRVLAVDRSRAQLARVAERVAARGFRNVALFEGSFEEAPLLERVAASGGADLVFAGRALHHAARPQAAVAALARLLKPGGHLVVLDYLSHEEESLRGEAGDAWLGFEVAAVRDFLRAAGLTLSGEVPVPPGWHPEGPDAALTWFAWVGQRPR